MRRPPYLRWAAAVVVVLIALAVDLSQGATAPHPFVAEAAVVGTPISGVGIEWREVPVGLLEPPALDAGYVGRSLRSGEPLLAGDVSSESPIPDDWWAVPLALPPQATRGTTVRLVILESDLVVDGIVTSAAGSGSFGIEEAGLVAVPGDRAAPVAAAAATGNMTILIEAGAL